jgi:hypothetical protein
MLAFSNRTPVISATTCWWRARVFLTLMESQERRQTHRSHPWLCAPDPSRPGLRHLRIASKGGRATSALPWSDRHPLHRFHLSPKGSSPPYFCNRRQNRRPFTASAPILAVRIFATMACLGDASEVPLQGLLATQEPRAAVRLPCRAGCQTSAAPWQGPDAAKSQPETCLRGDHGRSSRRRKSGCYRAGRSSRL